MKIKELKRTVNMSWSPAELYPTMLAAGSAAQQVDASFSSNSSLELYSLNLGDPSYDLELKASIQTEHKFQKLVWSKAGVIVGGCDGGLLEFYNVDKLLNNSSDALIGSCTKHTGQVSALDVNPYQKNLLASGASDSEIFIWDLNNTSQPMAPGARSAPHDHVQGLAWNQQVQHILGSTFATRCLVWDLRKNEPIMKLSDSQSGSRWRALAWHPQVATQLCVASDNDHAPVVQLWDLRLAASPLVTLEGHEKGVLSLSWSQHDEELLLSAGKDGRVLAWNPNNTKPGGEQVLEVCRQAGWVLQVSWAGRAPGLLAAAGFDRSLALHTLHHSAQGQSDIMESFGGAASFLCLPAVSAAPPPAPPAPHPPRAPRWLRTPAGASFAFGGKLVTFERCPREAGTQRLVYVSQVVSEPEIVEKAFELDRVIGLTLSQEPDAAEQLAEYCREKGDAAVEQHERYEWFFLRANFLPSFRTELLNLLGFKQDDVASKFKGQAAGNESRAPDVLGLSRTGSTETEAELSTDTSTDLSDAQTLIERKLASVELEPTVQNVVIPSGDDSTSQICRALVLGQLERAVELCLEAERVADALVIASVGSQELLHKVQRYHLNGTAADPVSLVAGGLLRARWDALVGGAAPACWRDVLAALLTHCPADELAHYCGMLGDRLAASPEARDREAGELCYVCAARGGPAAGRARGVRGAAGLAAAAERALLLRRAAAARGRPPGAPDAPSAPLAEYAARLAAQGCLRSALAALQGAAGPLAERLQGALHVRPDAAHQQPAQYQQRQPQQGAPRSRTASAHAHARAQYAHTPNDVANAYNQQPSEPASWSAPRGRSAPRRNQFGGDMFASHAGLRQWRHIRESRTHEPKQEVQQQAPITHPLFGVEPPQHVPLVPQGQYPGQNHNQYPGQNQYLAQNQFPPQSQFPGHPGQFPGQPGQFEGQPGQCPGQPGQFGAQQDQFPGQQHPEQYQAQYPPGYQQSYAQQAAPPAPPAAPAPPAPKPPLSPEHAPIQSALDELHRVCLERAHNTQTKRKLEDVQRRLETLYDMLRENKLSPAALSALQASAELAGRGACSAALGACAELAAGSDFAAAAAFLPGLKMLFLLADQLR